MTDEQAYAKGWHKGYSLMLLRRRRTELTRWLDGGPPYSTVIANTEDNRGKARTQLAWINAEIARRVGTYNHTTGYREARR